MAGLGGRVSGVPGRTSPPGSPPASGCDTPLTDTARWPGPTPPPSPPSAAPPPAGGGSAEQRGVAARGRRSALRCLAQRACL